MDDKRKGQNGRLRVVKPSDDTKQNEGKPFESFMPNTQSSGRREAAKKAVDSYRKIANEFIEEAVSCIKEGYEYADDVCTALAIELYVLDRMNECFQSVFRKIDLDLYVDLEKAANTAASYSRMVYVGDIAKSNFEDFAPQLNALCAKCEVETLGSSVDAVVSAYIPKAKELTG